jgi:hypothetical protein
MATLMNNGGRLTPANPNDPRCGFTGLPQIPRTRSNPTLRRKSTLRGGVFGVPSRYASQGRPPTVDATTARLRVATVRYRECRVRQLTQS